MEDSLDVHRVLALVCVEGRKKRGFVGRKVALLGAMVAREGNKVWTAREKMSRAPKGGGIRNDEGMSWVWLCLN